MSEKVKWHAAERVDQIDLEAQRDFERDNVALHQKQVILDRLCRIVQGFRVELPDQSSLPGRITVHGGAGWTPDGDLLLNEGQLGVTRTITLEGTNTDFYVEIEFIESEASVDSRAFWDSTVDQGTDVSGDALPDGQEFAANVATRLSPDWRIVQPVSTTGFARDSNPSSTRIPLIHVRTNGSNEIAGSGTNNNLTTEKAATTLLQQISTTRLEVQNPQIMPPAGVTLRVGVGAASQEDVTVTSVDRATGIVVVSVLTNSHSPGEIIRAQGASAPDFITENSVGLYRVRQIDAAQPNHQVGRRDMLFRGDEVHGEILAKGHASITDRSDVNLQAMKDQIDFLAAKLQEMQWGIMNPHTAMTDSSRTPPGIDGVSFPTTPRYFDRASGIAPSRMVTITVGDGTNSFGDFNGTDETVLQAAHDALPAAGGRIFIKKGTYAVGTAATFTVSNAGTVIIEAEKDAVLTSNGFYALTIGTAAKRVILKNLSIQRGSSESGISFVATTPIEFQMHNCRLYNAVFSTSQSLPVQQSGDPERMTVIQDCAFIADHANMSTEQLVQAGGFLGGWWTNCLFAHSTASTLDGVAIDGGGINTKFTNCDFLIETSASNTSVVALGASSNRVKFLNCRFEVDNTTILIDIDGGRDLEIKDCEQTDSVARLISAGAVTRIVIDGFKHTDTVNFAGDCIVISDCNQVKVINCDLRVTGSTALATPSIQFIVSTGTMEDILIANNTINADPGASLDNAVGMTFAGFSAHTMQNVKIVNNTIHNCEVGIYFLTSDASAVEYSEFAITGNVIYDDADSATVANNLKIGIFGNSSTVNYRKFVISGNTIRNCNPADTLTVGGQSRQGIHFVGPLYRTTIADNVIQRVGDTTNPLTNCRGIRLSQAFNCSITGNAIQQIQGTDAAAIGACDINNSSQLTISNNTIVQIASTTGNAVGILIANPLANTSIVGNTLDTMTTTSGGGAMIYASNLAGGTLARVAITGNVAENIGDLDFIFLRGQALSIIAVKGNVCYNSDRGILFEGNATSTCMQVTISDNAIECADRCIDINLNSSMPVAACRHITITGNMLKCTAADSTNIVIGISTAVACTGNTCENTGTHTAARGQNIFVGGAVVFSIVGNVCRQPGNATANDIGIEMATVDKFVLFGNVFDAQGGSATSVRIDGITPTLYGAYLAMNIGDTLPTSTGATNLQVNPASAFSANSDIIAGGAY